MKATLRDAALAMSAMTTHMNEATALVGKYKSKKAAEEKKAADES